MKLDLVHDIQGVYRKVLNAMANPGVIENIDGKDKVDIDIESYNSTFLVMIMLLDGEVTFNIVSKKKIEISKLISQITYAKARELEEADYVFILEDATDEKLAEVYEKTKLGDLVNPNKSATIIAEVNCIEYGDDIELRGPGIKECNKISVNINKNWIDTRAEKNKEYPLGIDAIYIDKSGNLIGLPRTTQVKRQEG